MNHDKGAGLARRGILWNSDRSGSEAVSAPGNCVSEPQGCLISFQLKTPLISRSVLLRKIALSGLVCPAC